MIVERNKMLHLNKNTLKERGPRFFVASDALHERQSVADAIRLLSGERRRHNGRIDADDLLQQRRDRSERVPQPDRQILDRFSLFTANFIINLSPFQSSYRILPQFEQSLLAFLRVPKVKYPLVHLLLVYIALSSVRRRRGRSFC